MADNKTPAKPSREPEGPRFELTAPHYVWDTILERGTIVGAGTSYPVGGDSPLQVSLNMQGLDEEAEDMVAEHRERKADPYNPGGIPGSNKQLPTGAKPNQTSLPKDI